MRTVERYLANGLRKVEGWLDPLSARMIAHLSAFQRARNIHGATGEIGVHHGKLWLILHLTTSLDERCFAIDLFDDQVRNVDQSGRGDLARFHKNITRFSNTASNAVIWSTSSLDVKSDELIRRCGKARLFSIDGGHTAECTYHDLMLAEQVIVDDGIVLLDDFFNPHWPDVSTGAAGYFQSAVTSLKPFAITPGKVLLAKQAAHTPYRDELRRAFGPKHREKSSKMFGSDVDIYGVAAASRTRVSRLVFAARQAYWRWHAKRR